MSDVGRFFEGKTVLVTGATGFLGKVLLERILRQLPGIRRIFLLVRPEAGKDPAESARCRAQREIFSSPIFDRLRARHGQAFQAFVSERVVILAGDLTAPDLGLRAGPIPECSWDVDLIINLAALVGFDERLDDAIKSNTLGPYHLFNFAKRFRNPTLLHVSTAYVHGMQTGSLPEQALEPNTFPADDASAAEKPVFQIEHEIERALRLAQSVESESQTPSARGEFKEAAQDHLPSTRASGGDEIDLAIERRRRNWVGNILSQDGFCRARRYGWFDTYTFTKAMGEQLLSRNSNGMSMIILRPSIIESSLVQPEPGWIEGFQTSTPILFGYGKGQIPDFPGRPEGFIDFIPVDFVVSAILAVLAAGNKGSNPRIFHVASSSENPLRLEQLMSYCREYFWQFPIKNGRASKALRPWKYRNRNIFQWWLDRRQQCLRVASAVNDSLDLCCASRLRHRLAARQAYLERLQYLSRLYSDYMRLQCQFGTDRTRGIFQSLDRQDQREFLFDPTVINWRDYIQEVHLPGVRRHVMKRSVAAAR